MRRATGRLEIESYGTSNLASDVVAVLDQLSLTRVSLVAYSIGTAVALHSAEVVSRAI
jgi:pimeloyl-ACP methyl ester carboxylesterase